MATKYKNSKVLSDVHVCLSNTENIDSESDSIESERWLTRYYFWLPQNPVEAQQTSNIMYNVSDQTYKCTDLCPPFSEPDVKKIYDSLEKQSLELDEDGDAVLVRRQIQNLIQNISSDSIQNSTDVNLPHRLDSASSVFLPASECVHSIPNHNVSDSSSIASVLFRRKELLNIGDIDVNVRQHGHLNTQMAPICDHTSNLPCIIGSDTCTCTDKSIYGKMYPTQLAHNFSPVEKIQVKDSSPKEITLDQTQMYSATEKSPGQIHSVSLNDGISDYGVFTIEHSLETPLQDVGFQVWSGAFFLCDYLVHNHRDLKHATILDLGAGTGITSIVAAMFAPCVVCTDYQASIVELSERNWKRNRDIIPNRTCDQVCFKILDWTADWTSQTTDSCSKYTITDADLQMIEEATLILAAEAIYDEELTDALFRTIYHLLLKPLSKTVLLTMERRVVFSAEDQDVCSPAYEHFLENLEDLVTVDEGPVCFTAEKLNGVFPQYFQYQRVKELELWKISSHVRISHLSC